MIKLAIVMAVSREGVIGKDGKIPWSIPEDTALFRKLCEGRPMIVGCKTFVKLPKKLKETGRWCIVGKDYIPTVSEALVTAGAYCLQTNQDTIICAGGSMIYQALWGLADEFWITHVEKQVDGDTYVPYYMYDYRGFNSRIKIASNAYLDVCARNAEATEQLRLKARSLLRAPQPKPKKKS